MRDGENGRGGFAQYWKATILKQRPLILPRRCYVYPHEAEEVERGALELLVQPLVPAFDAAGTHSTRTHDPGAEVTGTHATRTHATRTHQAAVPESFLATCALGFADPLAPTGVWACPDPAQLCAVAGGYAYLIDTAEPARFEQVRYRPVLAVHAVPEAGLLLFVGNRAILAYGAYGLAWESPPLSSEGVEVLSTDREVVTGTGWDLVSDRETSFRVDVRTGARTG